MAVTITVAELAVELRLGDSPEETAILTRLLPYCIEAVEKYAPNATDRAMEEAVVRLAGYQYDKPLTSRGDAYANALRSSGAARALLPYRVHRAGYAEAMEDTQDGIKWRT